MREQGVVGDVAGRQRLGFLHSRRNLSPSRPRGFRPAAGCCHGERFSGSTGIVLENTLIDSPGLDGIVIGPPAILPAPTGSATISDNTVMGLNPGQSAFINMSSGFNATLTAAALTLACTAFACSTGGSDVSQHGEPDGGSSSASSSGSGYSSSSGSASASASSSSGSSPSSGSSSSSDADGGTGSDAAAGPDGSDSGAGVQGPCDIYESANTPCVAAHSTVRALYGSYNGKLYQVQRVADNATKDIYPLRPGGYADSSAQDTFCAQTNCTISIIYDQSSQHNDLSVSPPATQIPSGGLPALADAEKITMAGSYPVYGIYGGGGVAYRNNHTTGVAKGNEPEAMYMVVDAARYSGTCCFDYGNAEANGMDDGNGTMEAVYWGSDTYWGGKGQGNGPWIAADLENGMFKCNEGFPQTSVIVSQACPTAMAQSITAKFATAMLKGPADNTFTLKSADAQSGTLVVQWDGPRPSPSGYYPKNLQGAIIVGTGGDGSAGGQGTFFEGAMTAGTPSDDIDDMVQANIVAAGYGQ